MKNQIAKYLLEIEAVTLNPTSPFTWASGIKSPIYCDNRKVLAYPLIRNFIKHSFVEKSKQFEGFDTIAGVATAGIPHGALLADALEKPFIYVRSKPKGHGMQNLIEGKVTGNEKVLVIEDLISTGGSSLKAVEALRAQGCQVMGVIAIMTYGFDVATKAFADANCKLETLSNYPTLLEEAVKNNYVEPEIVEKLERFSANPKNWQ